MTDVIAGQPAGVPWHCYSDAVHCANGHLLLYHEHGYRGNRRHVNGPEFFQCRKCDPPTQFLAVFVSRPTPMVFCYSLSRASYEYWDRQEQLPEIPELLHRLRGPEDQSLNPSWRPPKPKEKQ